MKLLKHRTDFSPEISFVLLDWSCRESFHLLDDLADQTATRDRYEVIWIEYYDAEPTGLVARTGPAAPDMHVVMQTPRNVMYHKHLMYNLGIALARGKIIVFCDSDAVVAPTFVESILNAFAADSNMALHLDEVRNNHPSFYPFCQPAIEDITGFGAINWVNGTTTGLLDRTDPLHSRNYGACMAARREDLLAVGGADMHEDYLGFICGPYEMTWRLTNAGKREVWHETEWLYHVWHPGQAGDGNLAGPHDGLHVSTRALTARNDGRIEPFEICPVIAAMRDGETLSTADILQRIFPEKWKEAWRYNVVKADVAKHHLDGRPCRPEPLFGRRFSRWHRLKQLPLLVGLIWGQLGVKRRAARYSQPGPAVTTAGGIWRRKFNAMLGFLRRIMAYDRYRLRQCWLALAYATQEGYREVVFCGDENTVRMLKNLASGLPLRVVEMSPEMLKNSSAAVIVARFVDISAIIWRLESEGVPRERVITLL